MAGLIPFKGPEAAAVGCEHLVAEDYVAILVKAELELGVGDDDALGQRVISALLIQGDRRIADDFRILQAMAGELLFKDFDASLKADVLVVVADLRLRAGGVNGLRELIALFKAFRKSDPADGAVLLVALPAAAGDIAADDALDGEHSELSAKHAVAVKALLAEEFRHIVHVDADHVVRDDVFCQIKPETGHLGQNSALLHDLVLQDHVKRGDPVGRHHDELIADIIDLTYLAFLDGSIFLHASFLL